MTAKRMLVTHAKAAPLVIAGENWVHTRPLNPSLKTEDYEAQPNPNSNPRSKASAGSGCFGLSAQVCK